MPETQSLSLSPTSFLSFTAHSGLSCSYDRESSAHVASASGSLSVCLWAQGRTRARWIREFACNSTFKHQDRSRLLNKRLSEHTHSHTYTHTLTHRWYLGEKRSWASLAGIFAGKILLCHVCVMRVWTGLDMRPHRLTLLLCFGFALCLCLAVAQPSSSDQRSAVARGGSERIKVLFTPTICRLRCTQGRCTNYCERGNVTTIYNSEQGGQTPPGSGFRVCEYMHKHTPALVASCKITEKNNTF